MARVTVGFVMVFILCIAGGNVVYAQETICKIEMDHGTCDVPMDTPVTVVNKTNKKMEVARFTFSDPLDKQAGQKSESAVNLPSGVTWVFSEKGTRIAWAPTPELQPSGGSPPQTSCLNLGAAVLIFAFAFRRRRIFT